MVNSKNFILLISEEPWDINEYRSQLKQFMDILIGLGIENKLALISLLPKNINLYLRSHIFSLLMVDFSITKDKYYKNTIMQFLITFSTELLYTILWEKVRDDCAEIGDWRLYDALVSVTIQNRKLFNKCLGCQPG